VGLAETLERARFEWNWPQFAEHQSPIDRFAFGPHPGGRGRLPIEIHLHLVPEHEYDDDEEEHCAEP
jgi:hypothetical protein